MINRIIRYSFFLLVYHLLLLVLPINYFLIGLRIPLIIQIFPWLFLPLIIVSPILTLLLAIRSIPSKKAHLRWVFPVAVSLIGYSPIIGFYFSLSSLTSLRDYSLLIFFPVLIGLIAFWGSHYLPSLRW